ncbi:hypothetical protein [Geotalea sp. SG265]|uniref:hypothetical protein n=1 Tax=Geotalea sp. SG265 TaxID=2922867 RepID=UPI001FAF9868|nr:hypothetical protein [Geotalea sp. SG265]
MQISPELGVAIMMNNYFHDVATALLAASAFVIHAIVRTQSVMSSREATLFFLRTYDQMVKFFRFALWWIVIGGIPRTIFYKSFEWANAADKLQVPALMVKHVVMAVLVIGGVVAWRRLKVKVAALRTAVQAANEG